MTNPIWEEKERQRKLDEKLSAEQAMRANYRGRENEKTFNAIQLAAILTKLRPDLSPYQVALDASQLFRLAKSKAILALHDCDHGLTEKQETSAERIAKESRGIAAMYGLTVEVSGDPRGYVLCLNGPGILSNNLGSGFGVA